MAVGSRAATLRARLAGGPLLVLPGAADGLSARVIADLGFEALYVTGAGVANTRLGVPDLGLVTVSELASTVEAICDVTEVPVVVDADTGFGGPLNVRRTVQLLERRGASAIQLEDQVSPKRCGHFAGTTVVPAAEMVQRLHAALDARRDTDLVIIARTDARASEGLEAALERALTYKEAGADMIFVEAPQSRAELAQVGATVPGPLMANMVEGGRTPVLGAGELAEMGFAVALYANAALRGAIYGMRRVLTHLRAHGTTLGVQGQMATWEERQALVGTPWYDALGASYESPEAAPAAGRAGGGGL